jgi:hypothetical protein
MLYGSSGHMCFLDQSSRFRVLFDIVSYFRAGHLKIWAEDHLDTSVLGAAAVMLCLVRLAGLCCLTSAVERQCNAVDAQCARTYGFSHCGDNAAHPSIHFGGPQ